MVQDSLSKILLINKQSQPWRLLVKVHKAVFGKDGKLHITVKHPMGVNYPSLIFDADSTEIILDEITDDK